VSWLTRARPADDFEAVTLPHLDALYALALRLTRNGRDAEDLVQDTMVKAFRFFHRFERGTNAKAWLFKILSNLFNNDYRDRSREREVMTDVEDQGAFIPSEPRSPEAEAISRRTAAEIQAALESLPHDFRLAVVLADLEELSYREIAEVMGCPVGTVMSRLHRGRKLLREALGERTVTDALDDEPVGGVVVSIEEGRQERSERQKSERRKSERGVK